MIGLGDIGFYALLIGLLVATELEALRTRAAAEGFYALLIGLLVATRHFTGFGLPILFLCPLDRAARSDMFEHESGVLIPRFYALLIGLLVATTMTICGARGSWCFYALLIGLLVATDPATDGP